MHKISQPIKLRVGYIRRLAKDNIKGQGKVNKAKVLLLHALLGAVLASILYSYCSLLNMLPYPYYLVVVSAIGNNIKGEDVA